MGGFALGACAAHVPPEIQQRGRQENAHQTRYQSYSYADWDTLKARVKRGEFPTTAAIEEAAKVYAEAHVAGRIARNGIDGSRESMVADAARVLAEGAISVSRANRHPGARAHAVRRVTNAPNPEKELRPAAIEMATRMESMPTGPERERAINRSIEELRAEVEQQHAASLQTQRQAQAADLTRQAMSNLSDMPREIRHAAERNVAESRSPFDRARPRDSAQTETAIRAEEARLRSVIEAGRENEVRQQITVAEAARRSTIQAACDAQAAVAGASVATPPARSRGGILAAAFAGALESAAAEERTRRTCYRLNGL